MILLNVLPFLVMLVLALHYFPSKGSQLLTTIIKWCFRLGWLLVILVIPGVHIWSFISVVSWILCFYSIVLMLRIKHYSWLLSSSIAALSVLIGSIIYEIPLFMGVLPDLTVLLFPKLSLSILLFSLLLIKNRVKPTKNVMFGVLLYVLFYPVYQMVPHIFGWIPRGITILLFLSIIRAFPKID